MIGHDHISPEGNVKLGDRSMTVLLQSKLSTTKRGDISAIAGRKCDEVERLVDVNQIKSMRTLLDHCS